MSMLTTRIVPLHKADENSFMDASVPSNEADIVRNALCNLVALGINPYGAGRAICKASIMLTGSVSEATRQMQVHRRTLQRVTQKRFAKTDPLTSINWGSQETYKSDSTQHDYIVRDIDSRLSDDQKLILAASIFNLASLNINYQAMPRAMALASLAYNNDNISATARDLGMHRRTLQRTLHRKPHEYEAFTQGIKFPAGPQIPKNGRPRDAALEKLQGEEPEFYPLPII